MTVPIGKEKSGKPIGLLLGASFGEDSWLIQAGKAVEAARTAVCAREHESGTIFL